MFRTIRTKLGLVGRADADDLVYSDLYEMMQYRCVTSTDTSMLPMIIGFRTKQLPFLTDPDPRPSFALLETSKEWQQWHEVFHRHVEYDEQGRMTDLPRLSWNFRESKLLATSRYIERYEPQVSAPGWTAVYVDINPALSPDDERPARGRYFFRQI